MDAGINRTLLRKIVACTLTALALWFVMFSPITAPHVPFWGMMAFSSAVLIVLSFTLFGQWCSGLRFSAGQIALGLLLAALLWGVFWVGDKISGALFSFARPQVDTIYALKDGTAKWLLAAQLLLLTGPAEEIFWRGCLQRNIAEYLQGRRGAGGNARLVAAVITLLVYTLIHLPSLNFMLIAAAAVAGGIWGLLYYLKPQWLPALIVSHAVWDTAVFVIFPIM